VTETPAPGRRSRAGSSGRRLDLTVVLAVLLPVTAVGLLATAGTEPVEPEPRPPATVELTSATLGCPTGLPGAQGIRVASAGDAAGEVSIGEEQATLEAARSLQVDAPDPAVVRAGGDLAPGLVAGRGGTTPLVATDCPRPVAEQWFTGVGAGARHSSVLGCRRVGTVNPDDGHGSDASGTRSRSWTSSAPSIERTSRSFAPASCEKSAVTTRICDFCASTARATSSTLGAMTASMRVDTIARAASRSIARFNATMPPNADSASASRART